MPFDAEIAGRRHDRDSRGGARDSAFLAKLDFLSIGTNDLIQYTLAVDRADDAVAHLYDPLHPGGARLIAMSIAAANKAGVPVAVCGEMAGERGSRACCSAWACASFSMHPAHILSVKQRVLTTDVAELRPVVDRIRRTDNAEKVVALLQKLNA